MILVTLKIYLNYSISSELLKCKQKDYSFLCLQKIYSIALFYIVKKLVSALLGFNKE